METENPVQTTRERDLYRNLSPLDHRYYLANPRIFDDLADCLSEAAQIRYLVRVEAALLEVNLRHQGLDPARYREDLDSLTARIAPEEVYAEEEKTQHNIRALVNVIKRRVPPEVSPLVHLGATSVDILDTAQAMRLRDALRQVVLPLLAEVQTALLDLAEKEAGTPQVGRTHGQHAVPLTFGFALAEYVSRLGKSLEELNRLSLDLRGKLAGAVGAYNATRLLVKDPEALEREFLGLLGLSPSDHSTQLVEPEHLLRLLLELNTAFGILANLADDLRHLQRSEIGEIREHFSKDQVGSSTMPQKRNPWNSEHVKSLWKAFSPRVATFFMDQISEHQRDLTNSASGRFVGEFVAGFTAAAARMLKILTGLVVNRDRMREVILSAGDLVMAEAAYILLAGAGETEAHELVRRVTLACEDRGTRLVDELKANAPVWKKLSARLEEVTGQEAGAFFSDPALYRGRAEAKTRDLVSRYRSRLEKLKEALQ